MGQTMMALVYGVRMTDDLRNALRDDPNDPDSDMDEVLSLLSPDYVETGEDFGCLAVPVLLGGAPGRRETMLEGTVSFSEIESKFPDEMIRAREKWDRIDGWAQTMRSVTLPPAELMLTVVERA